MSDSSVMSSLETSLSTPTWVGTVYCPFAQVYGGAVIGLRFPFCTIKKIKPIALDGACEGSSPQISCDLDY